MAYADIYNAANDPLFQGRCMVALWIAAESIVNEDPGTQNHAARLAWALRVQQGKLNITPANLAQAILRNATIASNPGAASDSDLDFQVGSVLPYLLLVG